MHLFFTFVFLLPLGDCQLPTLRLPQLSTPPLPPLPTPPTDLPTMNTFLTWLFNTTIAEVIKIADNFDFHDVESKDIKFLFYDSKSNNTAVEINSENYNLIEPSKPTKFIIHGWKSSGNADYIKNMAMNYHKNGVYNVFAVDWSEHSKKIYLHAASVTKNIGEVIANFILTMVKKNKINLENLHLIGHSLGAHVAGFVGRKVTEMSTNRIKRITALDAAAPLFEFPVKRSMENRINKEDATYVDSIHTNAGFLGMATSYATADYYVDGGGPLQPGCIDINIFESFVCSHSKSVEYYDDSIEMKKKYEAVSCPNALNYQALLCNNNKRAIMGEHTTTNATGVYYLTVSSPLPYRGLFG